MARANPQEFVGTWTNTNSNTNGITRLVVTASGNNLMIQAFGNCQPTDCDWGSTTLTTYGANVQDANHTRATALYQKSFAQSLLALHLQGGDRLNLQNFTRFTDGSGRQNYAMQEAFQRSRLSITPLPFPFPRPLPLREDCVSFNPATTTLSQSNGRWRIVDGNHSMFDFGNNSQEAQQALNVIKQYGMNQSCFVGRPDPSLSYLLVNNDAPTGSMPGEDCVSFNPVTTTVSQINGRWKIVDGNHWIFDFENNENEARQSLNIIQAHGFNRSCFVGRPDPSFTYLRQ
ncbi:hypothetical protein FLX56_28950 [Synechococcus moorigangaii CMS01]|nr:hypothetical protein [Synechococcus moorigangaii CMS01]